MNQVNMIKKAVAVVIENENGQILLTQRGELSRDEFSKWENCGGAVEENETKEEAILREVKEELGCKLLISNILYQDKFKTDSGTDWEVTIFQGKIIGTPIVQNKDNAAIKWFQKSELQNLNLASYTRKDFEKFGWIK